MSIAIAAIFKNEKKYILEWLAWHMLAGFKNFYIGDNGSSDGSLQLLEALAELGHINLLYQPVLKTRSQLWAYARISETVVGRMESLLFIDADEFLVHDSFVDGEEARCLEELLARDKVGSVSINWRSFGSSGLQQKSDEPVLKRFTRCCDDSTLSNNSHVKTAVNIKTARSIDVHFAEIADGYRRINVRGEDITDCVEFVDDIPAPAKISALTQTVVSGPLRVNHYVVKSLQEFVEKKNSRGSAMRGSDHDRGMAFFHQHDFDSDYFCLPEEKLTKLAAKMEELETQLRKTSLFKTIKGFVDLSDANQVTGWLSDEDGKSSNLCANIFVNGEYRGSAKCGFLRSDLLEVGVSADGASEFRWTHPRPLAVGDVVEVKVNANNLALPGQAHVLIQ